MKIVLLADRRKYELLINFCIAYKEILGKEELSSQFNLSRQLSEVLGISVETITSDRYAQIQQLAHKVSYNEIDAIIYLRDPVHDDPVSRHGFELLTQACDLNSVPYATNLASAEILVLAIDRGDLSWRDLIHERDEDEWWKA